MWKWAKPDLSTLAMSDSIKYFSSQFIIFPRFRFIYSYLTPIYHLCPYLYLFISRLIKLDLFRLYLFQFSIIYPCLVIFTLNWPWFDLSMPSKVKCYQVNWKAIHIWLTVWVSYKLWLYDYRLWYTNCWKFWRSTEQPSWFTVYVWYKLLSYHSRFRRYSPLST